MAISSISSSSTYTTSTTSTSSTEDATSLYFEELKEKQEELKRLQESEDSDEDTEDQITALQEGISSIRETLGLDENEALEEDDDTTTQECPPAKPLMDDETMERLALQYSELQTGYDSTGDSVLQSAVSTFNVEA